MSYILIIRPEAEQDLGEGRDWYEGQKAGLGDEFLTTVEESFEQLRQNPCLFASEYRSVRRCRLNRFPYVVYYRLVGETVEIIAVQHGSRHPRGWRSRL